jgi:type VI secretion system protein VasJ
MFGLMRKPKPWLFAAFGKHPAAGDFIRIGPETPLLAGFSAWMETGFSRLPEEARERKGYLWRFWTMGPSGKLILGLVKSSEDTHGRIHPLLVIGEGKPHDALSANWDILPFFCDRTWQDLDKNTRKKITAIRDLPRMLSRVKNPSDSVRVHLEKREKMKSTALSRQRNKSAALWDFMNKMNNVEGLSRQDIFSVRVDVGFPEDALVPAVKLLSLLKTRSKVEPRSVFIGGRGHTNRMIVFRRSLQTDDFSLLWASPDMEA